MVVVTQVKLIKAKHRASSEKQAKGVITVNQDRLEALLLREEKIKQHEKQLDLKEQEIRDQEKALDDKEAALILKREEETSKQGAKRLKNRKKDVNGLFQKFRKEKEAARD